MVFYFGNDWWVSGRNFDALGNVFLLFVPFLSVIWIVMQKAARPEKNIRIAKKLLWDYWRFLLPLIIFFFLYSLAIGGLYNFVWYLLMTMAASGFFAVLYEIGYRLMCSPLLPLCFLTAYTLNSAVPIAGWTEKFSFFTVLFQSQLRFMPILVYAVLAGIGYMLCQKNSIRG